MKINYIYRQIILKLVDDQMKDSHLWSQSRREETYRRLSDMMAGFPVRVEEAELKIGTLLINIDRYKLPPIATQKLSDVELPWEDWLNQDCAPAPNDRVADTSVADETHREVERVMTYVAGLLLQGGVVDSRWRVRVGERTVLELVMTDLSANSQVAESMANSETRIKAQLKQLGKGYRPKPQTGFNIRLMLNILGMLKDKGMLKGTNEGIAQAVMGGGNPAYLGKQGWSHYEGKYSALTPELHDTIVSIIDKRMSH